MNAYKVTMNNGKVYEFTIEQIDKADIKAAPAAPAAPAAAPAAPIAEGSAKVTSPMPGTILKVNVKAGQAVKKGDVLFILEAMKMENEICCPADATVAGVAVNQGASVETGALLCTLA